MLQNLCGNTYIVCSGEARTINSKVFHQVGRTVLDKDQWWIKKDWVWTVSPDRSRRDGNERSVGILAQITTVKTQLWYWVADHSRILRSWVTERMLYSLLHKAVPVVSARTHCTILASWAQKGCDWNRGIGKRLTRIFKSLRKLLQEGPKI